MKERGGFLKKAHSGQFNAKPRWQANFPALSSEKGGEGRDKDRADWNSKAEDHVCRKLCVYVGVFVCVKKGEESIERTGHTHLNETLLNIVLKPSATQSFLCSCVYMFLLSHWDLFCITLTLSEPTVLMGTKAQSLKWTLHWYDYKHNCHYFFYNVTQISILCNSHLCAFLKCEKCPAFRIDRAHAKQFKLIKIKVFKLVLIFLYCVNVVSAPSFVVVTLYLPPSWPGHF